MAQLVTMQPHVQVSNKKLPTVGRHPLLVLCIRSEHSHFLYIVSLLYIMNLLYNMDWPWYLTVTYCMIIL
jgi:hypothetical protein